MSRKIPAKKKSDTERLNSLSAHATIEYAPKHYVVRIAAGKKRTFRAAIDAAMENDDAMAKRRAKNRS